MDRINVYSTSDEFIGTLPMPDRDLLKRDWIEYPLSYKMDFREFVEPVLPDSVAAIDTVAFEVGYEYDHLEKRKRRALKLRRGRTDQLDRLSGWRCER